MSVREYECVPCVRDRVNKFTPTPTDNTQCDSRHARTARTLMVTQIRSELKSTVGILGTSVRGVAHLGVSYFCKCHPILFVPLLLQESSLHFLSFFVKTFLVYLYNITFV